MSNSFCNIAVVVIAFNRINSLRRLIRSLLEAEYFGDKVDLIVSLDNSGSDELVNYAKSVKWPYGDIKVISRKDRLGLKRHVIECGNLTELYENICVFEDDIYASPGFYGFAKAAVNKYKNCDNIAGISLYGHQWNPYVDKPFVPMEDGYDVFFMQVASSWGQVWSKSKWSAFVQWMSDQTDESLFTYKMPTEVSSWSKKSWLKFHNKYLVDTNKYFIFPRKSLATNFSDQGEHASVTSTYQVPILLNVLIDYRLPNFLDDGLIYDSFFENKKIYKSLEIKEEDVDVCLYGNREIKKRYVLATKRLDYAVVKSFGLKMRPIDSNVVFNIEGNDIFLYDTNLKREGERKNFSTDDNKIIYDLKTENKLDLIRAAIVLYKKSIKRKIKSWRNKI